MPGRADTVLNNTNDDTDVVSCRCTDTECLLRVLQQPAQHAHVENGKKREQGGVDPAIFEVAFTHCALRGVSVTGNSWCIPAGIVVMKLALDL